MKHPLIHILFAALLLGVSLAAQAQQRSGEPPDSLKARAAYIEGLRAFENEEYTEAVQLLSAAQAMLSDHAAVNFALADAYLRAGKLPDASAYGRQAVELEPANKWFRLKLEEIYRTAGRNDAAVTQLREALKHHPNDTDVIYRLADALARQGERAESNRLYNRMIRLRGPSVEVYLQKLRNFSEMAQQDSSIATLNRIRELDPGNLANLQLLSQFYRKMGRDGQAKAMLREALERNRRDPNTLLMFSEMLASEAKWDSVSTLLGDLVSDSLVARDAKMSVAEFMLSRFRQDTAGVELREATGRLLDRFRQAEPEFGPAHALAADFFSYTGQNGRALKALASTTELMPSNSQAWIQRLQLLSVEGRAEEVVELAPRAEENVPQNPFVLYFTGSAHLQRGDYEEAARKLEQAAGLPARSELKAAIYTTLGDAWSSLDAWEESNSAYEQALQLDPGNATLLNNYAYALSRQQVRLEEAERMILRALDMQPANAAFLDTAGWVYFQLEQYGQARDYIRKSIDTGEASAEVLEHMGDVMERMGNLEEARSWWRKALEMAPSRTHLKEKLQQRP
ncbi:MAG: tetratricopeptide repeat protein [Balneolaceae bacterium]|nr:tetratricopeptide repeat protein [Balneolaceae bacterium]